MSILRLDISESEWNRLCKLLDVPHKHSEGMNECRICDEPIVTAAANEITRLTSELAVANEANLHTRAVLKAMESDLRQQLAAAKQSKLDAEKVRRLLQEVMGCHAEPGNVFYNECDKGLCGWCAQAADILAKLGERE